MYNNSSYIKSVSYTHLDVYKRQDIEAKYGDGFDRFLQFIRTILVKEKARANLLDEFKEKVYDKKVLMRGKETFDLVAVSYTHLSGKSSRFLRINMLLNGLTHSLHNIIEGDTLDTPAHYNIPPVSYTHLEKGHIGTIMGTI